MIRRARRTVPVLAFLAFGVVEPACYQYRQQARSITPASECPDFSRGCTTTRWSAGYGEYSAPAQCGAVGLAEVTVRDQPHFFLLTVLTLGLAAPRSVEWKCARPNPAPGDLLGVDPPPDSVVAGEPREGSTTAWSWVWGAATSGTPPAECGDVGLAEVTVRDLPHFFLLTVVSLGLASPKRIRWTCAGSGAGSGPLPLRAEAGKGGA
jgi:hypothetical protein